MKNINEDLIKRSLLYMNYDSKKTLSENLDRTILNEEILSNMDPSGEEKYWKALNSRLTTAGYPTKPSNENQSWWGPFIFYKIYKNEVVIATVKKTDGTTCYANLKPSKSGFKYAGQTLDKVEIKDSCGSGQKNLRDFIAFYVTQMGLSQQKSGVVGSESKGNDNMAGEKYWGALLERLKAAGYPFKSGVTSGTNLPIYWWGPFIIYRYGRNFITYTKGDSSGNAKISSTSYKGKYAGQVITDILLTTNVVRFTGESPNLKEWIDYLNPTKEKTPEKTKDWEDGGGVRNDPGPKPDYTPGGGGKTKNECKGTYSMGCITPEVGEAQQCLKDEGLYPYRVDNKFGSKTRDAVKAKIGKTYFTDADLQTICKTTQGGGGEDEYDFDKDMGGRSGEQEKEDTTWTGDVY